MYFDINLKLLSGKKYSKSKLTKYSGFIKLDVGWAERDIYSWKDFSIPLSFFDTSFIKSLSCFSRSFCCSVFLVASDSTERSLLMVSEVSTFNRWIFILIVSILGVWNLLYWVSKTWYLMHLLRFLGESRRMCAAYGAVHKLCRLKIGNFDPLLIVVF